MLIYFVKSTWLGAMIIMGEKLLNLELVIFDLDGTLIDSNGIHNQLDVEWIRTFDEDKSSEEILKERDEVLKVKNTGDIYLNYSEYLKKKYKLKLSADEILNVRRKLSKQFLKEVKLKPKADEMIKYLKGNNIKLALATVSRKADLEIYINENENIKNKCNLNECFDYIITKDDVTLKKPNPEVYNKIIEKFGIKDLSKCIVIEDSLSGVCAAKNANLKVIAIYDRYSDKDREGINELADYTVDSFEELMKILNK